jgi:ribosomal-protein-alanine N-acetyltransferase
MTETRLDPFSPDLLLQAGDYELRALRYADAPDVQVHFSDPLVTEFMDIDPVTDLEEARGIIRWADGVREFGEGVRYAVRERVSGAFVGTAGFNTIEVDRGRRAEIAYDLSHDFWGKGVMAVVLPRLIALAYDDMGLHRLEAFVTPGNDRSVRLLEKHGFVLEGRLRDYGWWKGRFWDQLVLGRVKACAAEPR